jgi:hypothetical protein
MNNNFFLQLTLVDEQFFIDNKSDVTNRKEISEIFNESSKVKFF